jgi:hypothetical protein
MTAADMPMSSSDATTTSSAIEAINSNAYSEPSITSLITYVQTLQRGTYSFRADNVTEAPESGGVVYTVNKTHGLNDTRCVIKAIPMYAGSTEYVAFVGASATGITWQQLATADKTVLSKGLVVVNCNNVTESSIIRTGTGSTNTPTSNTSGILITYVALDNVLTQTYTYYEGTMFVRENWYGTWTAWRELATADRLSNAKILHFNNANSIVVDLGYIPSTSSFGHIFLWNANRHLMAMILPGESSTSYDKIGTSDMTFTFSRSDSVLTITPSSTMWGVTTIILDRN